MSSESSAPPQPTNPRFGPEGDASQQGKGSQMQTKSPLFLDQRGPSGPGALPAPLALALGATLGHLAHSLPDRSCQNPDVFINPGPTALSDEAERWIRRGTTLDLCQGWRIQLLHAPCPLLYLQPQKHAASLSLGSTAAPNNDGGDPIH